MIERAQTTVDVLYRCRRRYRDRGPIYPLLVRVHDFALPPLEVRERVGLLVRGDWVLIRAEKCLATRSSLRHAPEGGIRGGTKRW